MDEKLLKIARWVINAFTVLLVICAAALPWAVTWYVETMGRSPKLPAIIMVTCYPCVPIAAAILMYLKRIIKNISKDMLFHLDNVIYFKRISFFCLMISVITVIAGRFYLPFFIMGISFGFFSFMIFIFKAVYQKIAAEIDKNNKTDLN